MSPTLPRLLLLLLLPLAPGKLPPGPSEQRPQRALLSLPRALSAAGPQPLSRRGATVLGSTCTHRPVCVPAAAVQYPRRYGQNFPATRHSRLSVCLADHEHAAEAESCFALLPDSLMLHIACFCDEVPFASPRRVSPLPPRLHTSPHSASSGHNHAHGRCVLPPIPPLILCNTSTDASAGVCSCATLQCGAPSASLRGPATPPPCHTSQISGAAGRQCCSRGRA